MANAKISALPDAGVPQDTDQFAVARAGSPFSALWSALKAAAVSTAEGYTDTAVAALSTVYQPLDSDLTSIAALTTTSFGRALLALADAAALRTAAGLGTAATHATGDFDAAGAAAAAAAASQPLDSDLTSIAALTTTSFGRAFLALADIAAARTALSLVPGTDVQAQDAELAALAGLTSAANKLPYFTGSGTAAVADFTAAGRALVDDADASAQRTTLGLAIGTDVQAQDAELAALAGLTSAANKLPYFTGSGTAALTDLSAFIRTLLDDADAATAIATLGAIASGASAGGDLTGTYPNPTIGSGKVTSAHIADGAIVNADVNASAAIAYSKLALTSSIVAGDISDVELASIAGLTSAANKVPYFTGSGTAAVADFTATGRSLVDDADIATMQVTLGMRNPLAASGALYETVQRQHMSGSTVNLLSSQRLSMVAIWLPNGLTITNITFLSGSTALNTGVHQLFGLFDDSAGTSSGTGYALLRGTSDDTSTAWAGTAFKTLALTTTYPTTRTGLFYLGILVQATTVPTLIGNTTASAVNQLAPIISGAANSSITALPNPASAPNTGASFTPYAYVS